MAGNERLGAQSPASLVATDTYLMRELLVLLYPSFLFPIDYKSISVHRPSDPDYNVAFITEDPVKRYDTGDMYAVFHTVFDQMLLYFRIAGGQWFIGKANMRLHRYCFFDDCVFALFRPRTFSIYNIKPPAPIQYDFSDYFDDDVFDFENIADCSMGRYHISFLIKTPSCDKVVIASRCGGCDVFGVPVAPISEPSPYDIVKLRQISFDHSEGIKHFVESCCVFGYDKKVYVLLRERTECYHLGRFHSSAAFKFYMLDLTFSAIAPMKIAAELYFMDQMIGTAKVLSMEIFGPYFAQVLRINYLTNDGRQRNAYFHARPDYNSMPCQHFKFSPYIDGDFIPLPQHRFPEDLYGEPRILTLSTGAKVIESPRYTSTLSRFYDLKTFSEERIKAARAQAPERQTVNNFH